MADSPKQGGTGNLPAELTSFIGRSAELAIVKDALSSSRLVTLVGAGGVGKTRLALRVGENVQRAFKHGVWFVDVSPLRDEQLLAPTLAAALDLQSRSTQWAPSVLGRQLAGRSMLIILDNCEYLSDACAILADTLLKRCPELRILATSRQPLEIAGEHLQTVPPLTAPEPSRSLRLQDLERYDAVTLFVDRARASDPGFALTERNASAVAGLCQRLDGLPLALELAAARIRHLSPQQILSRLDERFGLLNSGSQVAAPRQRSLRSLIGWSHDLCTPPEQTLWARLAVFSGSFAASAAESVCSGEGLDSDAVLPTLASLVDKSIIVTERHDAEVRYRMLETIRSFGLDQLTSAGKQVEFQRRHRDYYRDFVINIQHQWFGPAQPDIMDWMRRERDNLRSAIDFSLGDPDDEGSAAIIAMGLSGAAIVGGLLSEAVHLTDRVMAEAANTSPARAVLLWVGAWAALQHGSFDSAEAMLADARRFAMQIGDPHDGAMAAAFLGISRLIRGFPQEALDLFDEALKQGGEGDHWCRAVTVSRQGVAAYHVGNREYGLDLCRQAIALSEAHDEQWHKAESLWELSNLYWQEGRLADAAECAREALRIHQLFHNAVGMAQCFETLACIASHRREFPRAARLFGAGDALWQDTDAKQYPYLNAQRDECAAKTRRALNARRYDEAHRAGLRAAPPENTAYALGEPDQAEPAVLAAQSPLTRRERQVAELLGGGATNKEIAASLVISTRTAECHVENILAKLGFSSRTQIAVWLTEQRVTTGAGKSALPHPGRNVCTT